MSDEKEFPCAICHRDLCDPAELFECRNEHTADLSRALAKLRIAEEALRLIAAGGCFDPYSCPGLEPKPWVGACRSCLAALALRDLAACDGTGADTPKETP